MLLAAYQQEMVFSGKTRSCCSCPRAPPAGHTRGLGTWLVLRVQMGPALLLQGEPLLNIATKGGISWMAQAG